MRYFITIGSPECPHLGLPKLAKVGSDVEAVAELLNAESQGYSRALAAELPLGTPSGVIKHKLGKWFLDDARTEGDCVVIYVAGHGDSFGQFTAHCLLTSDTEPRNIDTVVKVEELIERIFAAVRYPRNVLLILDVCFAGRGAAEAVAKVGTSLKKAFPSGAGLRVVATADRNSEADDGPFVRAWQALMADKNGAWLSPGGKKYLYPDEFVLAVNEYLGPASPQRVVPFCAGGPDEPTFIKNPWYTPDLDGLTVDLVNHWAPKARGDDTKGTTGPSYFTGRGAVLAACRAWLRADTSDGLARAVTGAPGSGKSAVLGQVVLNPGESAPPLARVHARGQQTEEVAVAIAKQLTCKETKPDRLVAELAAKPDPVGIVVDSLDEAVNPAQLERDLLRGLAACPLVRLIVGVRSRPGTAPLAGARVELDLDSPEFFDPADVEGYAFALLTATRGGKPATYAPEAAHATAREVARFVAERAKKSFLYARLASRGLAAADPVDTADPNWKAKLKLPDGIEAMFGADLDHLKDPDERQRFIDLLVPLAYARRRGLPQKHVWAAVASRIARKQYTNADIRELKERAGFYLIQDTEDGETVYRLFHQSFADYLKTLTRDEDVEVEFAAALEDLVTKGGGWIEVREPYLLTAFPSHAAAVGRLGKALADAAFLVKASPQGLLPELHKVSDPQAWPLAQAYRQASHRFAAGEIKEGARYLLLAALKYQSTLLSERLTGMYGEDSPWWPQWARWCGTLAGWVGVEAHATITALCASHDPVGNMLAVCGHNDGSVSTWRLDNRARLLDYRPPGETARVTSLAVADCRGEQIVVGVWEGGSVRAFRQATGETTGHWERTAKSDQRLTNVITVDNEGAPLATVGDDTELLLFELPRLSVRAHRPDAAKASLYSLAVARWNNRPVIVSGGDTLQQDGKKSESYPVKLWGIDSLECLLEGGEDIFLASRLLVFEEAGESFLLSSGFGAVTVRRVADLGLAAPRLRTADDYVAAYPADGHTVIFRTNCGRMGAFPARRVQAVDSAMSAIELSLEPRGAGADTPASLWSTVVELEGRPVLLSAEAERVHVWDVVELLRPAGSPTGIVPTITDVRSLAGWGDTLFLGTQSGAVSAWDRAGNQLWSRDLTPNAIQSLAVSAGGAELLAGGTDGKIYRLDTATGGEWQPALAAGSAVHDLVVQPTARGEQVFAAIEVRAESGLDSRLYFTRAWNLSTGAEIPTWKSKVGPEVLRGEFEWTLGYTRVNGFEPALAPGGYYRTKSLNGITAFEFEGRTVVALAAGLHGEVRMMDAGALEELNAWVGGSSGAYVQCLAGGVVGGVPYVFGGDERGQLFRGGTPPLRQRPQAHRGPISVLTLHETPRGWVVASGGGDGLVRFWTPDLERLIEIDAGRPVISLAWLGDDLVIAADRGVLCVTVRC